MILLHTIDLTYIATFTGFASNLVFISMFFANHHKYNRQEKEIELAFDRLRIAAYGYSVVMFFIGIYLVWQIFNDAAKIREDEAQLKITYKIIATNLQHYSADSARQEKAFQDSMIKIQTEFQNSVVDNKEFDDAIENSVEYCLKHIGNEINRCQSTLEAMKVNDSVLVTASSISPEIKDLLLQSSDISKSNTSKTQTALLVLVKNLNTIRNRAKQLEIQNLNRELAATNDKRFEELIFYLSKK